MGWLGVIVVAILLVSVTVTNGVRLCDNKCKSGQSCMPTDQQWTTFSGTLTGQFLSRTDSQFDAKKKMWNGRVNKNPIAIVLVSNVDDIKKCLAFAKEHNLGVSIRSSGHSFIGRSVETDSLLISLEGMKTLDVRTAATARSPDGEITVQSGASWVEVYEELDSHGRVVVGGSAHTVGMGGYTQGGGHSPMSRYLGLAVDNLLAVELVTADGDWLTVDATGTTFNDNGTRTADTDLFWALRGGGGGTWGVVISFTFKLHVPPSQFVQFIGAYPMYYDGVLHGVDTLRRLLPKIEKLPKEWGGYIIAGPASDDPRARGGFLISLLHYGPWGSDSFNAIWPIFFDPGTPAKWLVNKTSFWDYEQNVTDADSSGYNTYILNTLVQPGNSGKDLPKVMEEELFSDLHLAYTQCTFTMLGGKTNEPDDADTPVNPGFRSASFSLSCGRTWESNIVAVTTSNIRLANRFSCRLQEFGKGMYFNEPTEQLPWWKVAFWGSLNTYNRLLAIKKKWDPSNLFCCKNCVGSDLDPDANPEEDPTEESSTCSGANQTARAFFVMSSLLLLFLF